MKIVAIGSNVSSPAGLVRFVVQSWQKQIAPLYGAYRPERYYMRGPGPKCRAKHRLLDA